ncbi:MAG TPA: hypothetical protein VN025_17145 [Candidatus Dormibacteraeota bacterium]|nr:hypothetical protein [Candidatus Dormibacteraeota bacterium]
MAGKISKVFFHLAGLTILSLTASGELHAQVQDLEKPIWSVSLEPQGYHPLSKKSANFAKIGGIATSTDIVAVLLGITEATSIRDRWTAPWDIYVLLYDASTGQFLSKNGPWKSGWEYELTSTGSGLFVLVVSPLEDSSRLSREFLLLTREGKVAKTLKLSVGETEATAMPLKSMAGTELLHSPTGRTILMLTSHYGTIISRVVNADSLEVLSESKEALDTNGFRITGISDDEMVASSGNSRFSVRKFDGGWRPLDKPLELPPNATRDFWQFLDSNKLVGQVYVDRGEFVVSFYDLPTGSSTNCATKGLAGYNTFLSRFRTVSQDGQYFEFKLYHRDSVSHWLDEKLDGWAFGISRFSYIWSAASCRAVARIAHESTPISVSFFPPGIAEVAIVDGSTLKVFSIPSNSPPH